MNAASSSSQKSAPQIHVFSDKAALVAGAAEQVIALMRDAIATTDRCTIALSGGSTPKPLYQAIAQTDLPWDKIYVYWGDERYVPATHADSNAKMAREAWLDHVAIPAQNVFVVPTDTNSPEITADRYQQALVDSFQATSENDIPRFDLILLGMGDDGHTASLFPHTLALNESYRWVTVGNKDGQPRITFTVPLINNAHHVMFVVAGANKQAALSQVFAPVADSATYPSRLIAPLGQLRWLLDSAASQGLPPATEPIVH
ncbi:MAG: 6-phosphogluconolactonase [Cyanobacteria bacterium P01_B01_bin.77]